MLNDFLEWCGNTVLHLLTTVFGWVQTILTATPDVTALTGGLSAFYSTMWQLALVLYVGFVALAALRYALTSVANEQPYEAIGSLRRGVVGIGLLLALQPLLHQWFALVNDVATIITQASNGPSAFSSLSLGFASMLTGGSGLATVGVAMVTGNPAVLLAAIFLALVAIVLIIAIAIVRLSGLFVLVCLYAVSPACLVTWVSPEFAGIARWWVASFISYSLWGVAYALVLKVDLIMLNAPTLQGLGGSATAGTFLSVLLALAGLLVLWRVPRLMDGVLGGLSSGASGTTAVAGMATALISRTARGV
jgi:hypothetical protein